MVDTFGSIETGRAGAVIYINLTHSTTESWKAERWWKSRGNLKLLIYSCTVRKYLLANPWNRININPVNLNSVASLSTHTTPWVDWFLIQTTSLNIVPILQVKEASAWKLRWPRQTETKQMEQQCCPLLTSMPAFKTERPPRNTFLQ